MHLQCLRGKFSKPPLAATSSKAKVAVRRPGATMLKNYGLEYLSIQERPASDNVHITAWKCLAETFYNTVNHPAPIVLAARVRATYTVLVKARQNSAYSHRKRIEYPETGTKFTVQYINFGTVC